MNTWGGYKQLRSLMHFIVDIDHSRSSGELRGELRHEPATLPGSSDSGFFRF